METLTKQGIDICRKAFEVIQTKNKDFVEKGKDDSWNFAFLHSEFVDCYIEFNEYLGAMGIRGKNDSPLAGEKFLAYVKLWGKPSNTAKTFQSLNRNGAITQSRTTMIKNAQGQILSMPQEARRIGIDIIRKGGKVW